MKILLDEMYAGLKEYFETLGYEVLTAQEAGLKSAKDRDIVEYAGKNNLDFGYAGPETRWTRRASWSLNAFLFLTWWLPSLLTKKSKLTKQA